MLVTKLFGGRTKQNLISLYDSDMSFSSELVIILSYNVRDHMCSYVSKWQLTSRVGNGFFSYFESLFLKQKGKMKATLGGKPVQNAYIYKLHIGRDPVSSSPPRTKKDNRIYKLEYS